MAKLLILIAIIAGLYVFLPPMPATFWAAVPMLLVISVFFDAFRRGRRILAQRDEKAAAMDNASQVFAGILIFHAVWAGLNGPDPAATHSGVHGHGGDMGGFDGGGFDGGGGVGGGDGGGGGF